ncbi:M14 family zinc carboxypeptidase [Microbispora sp. NPDC049125]|uniref:M14 family metallopeptidase n=1 Tax=Microbispora sp. NPDC049125 TaxID=3154929 RepID=UPI00346653EF
MPRRLLASLLASVLASVLATGAPPAVAPPTVTPPAAASPAGAEALPPADRSELYRVEGPPGTGATLAQEGFDVVRRRIEGARERVELTAARAELAGIRDLGLAPRPVRDSRGRTQLQAARAQAAGGYAVWRSYSQQGGIADKLRAIAAHNGDVAKLESIGRSVQGKDILAVRLTRGARILPDGARPSVLYAATQHAREWIAAEVDMRLLEYLVARKDTPDIARLLSTTEVWFVPVANPDGYDYTFTPGNRLWRKNLRDNDGDGRITRADGVDPNRNFPTRWGYDEEGSSGVPSSQTYRGPAPASEPETRAMDGLLARLRFRAMVNYHSFGPLLLYPEGWQVATRTADDPVYQALSGTDGKPAVPGFDPGVNAELYTTNGETTDHAHAAYGTLAWTPELGEGCRRCGFVFPDDEARVQAEFDRQLPFALDVARSAVNPADAAGHLGTRVPDFVLDPFEVAYGTDQVVQVDAKRRLGPVELRYRIGDGPVRSAPTAEWRGGERYGAGYDTYFHRLRGTVTGARPGDRVTVWFASRAATSGEFAYRVSRDIGGDVLIVAAEDVTGAGGPRSGTGARYAAEYARALAAAGYSSDVYDVDRNRRTAPHPLGVLSHYRAVVWETGDNVVPRAPGQPRGTAANLAEALELSFRDYLNEGGRLLVSGRHPLRGRAADGAYWYQPDYPARPECAAPVKPPCLMLSDDFAQYYLGAYTLVRGGGQDRRGDALPMRGAAGDFAGFAGTLSDARGDRFAGTPDGRERTSAFITTSSVLPPRRFPQFAGAAPLRWAYDSGSPFAPHTGAWTVRSGQADASWQRLTRTVDLTGRSRATLSFWASTDTEPDGDFLTVEARTPGRDDWTTLPDRDGQTSRETGDGCGDRTRIHPFLAAYETPGGPSACVPKGRTGVWNAASGFSGGWRHWSVDLSRYAGGRAEVSISFVSDRHGRGIGVLLDDVEVTADGTTLARTSFEDGLGGWTVAGPPPGSARGAATWTRSDVALQDGAAVTTRSTVYFGFGLEDVATPALRADLVKRALAHLLGPAQP